MKPEEMEDALDRGFKNESEYFKYKVMIKRELRRNNIHFEKEATLSELEEKNGNKTDVAYRSMGQESS